MPVLYVPDADANSERWHRTGRIHVTDDSNDAACRWLRGRDTVDGVVTMLPKMPTSLGLAAALALLAFYGAVLTLVGGVAFTREQFAAYWPYTFALAAGFGIQVALYVHLRRLVHGPCPQAKVVTLSGAASAGVMVSCCAHYLANLLPIVGVAGVRAIVAEFQVQLFWIGLVSSAAGIAWIGAKVVAATKAHARCVATG